MLDESLLFCCVKVQAVIFPIIGIRAWERRAERKIIFPIIILPHEKHLGQGIQYLALRLVLMDAEH